MQRNAIKWFSNRK